MIVNIRWLAVDLPSQIQFLLAGLRLRKIQLILTRLMDGQGSAKINAIYTWCLC